MADISFWLDYYDDIYSDFDPRKYHKRRLSEDLLDELKVALKNQQEKIDTLVLMLPKEQRKEDIEPEIIANLSAQFRGRFEICAKKERRILRRGIMLVLSGAIFMYVFSEISLKQYNHQLMVMLRIIIEPGAWFMIWTGLDALFYHYLASKKETDFYKTLAGLKVRFENI